MTFSVERVASKEELWQLLAANPEAYLIAGGTDIIPRVNQGIEAHPLYVCIEGIPGLTEVTQHADGTVEIGAMCRLRDIALDERLADFSALRYAASRVASPQIRTQGTIGGNLLQENRCNYFNQSVSWRRERACFKLGGDRCYQYKKSPECVALFQSDTAPALLACQAFVRLESVRGHRELPLSELYLAGGNKAKEKDELLTAILIPPVAGKLCSAYARETIRLSFDFPLVSAAVALTLDKEHKVASAAIVIGSAGVKPRFVPGVQELLAGKTLAEVYAELSALEKAASTVIAPFKDSRVDGPTRKALGKHALKVALAKACAQES